MTENKGQNLQNETNDAKTEGAQFDPSQLSHRTDLTTAQKEELKDKNRDDVVAAHDAEVAAAEKVELDKKLEEEREKKAEIHAAKVKKIEERIAKEAEELRKKNEEEMEEAQITIGAILKQHNNEESTIPLDNQYWTLTRRYRTLRQTTSPAA